MDCKRILKHEGMKDGKPAGNMATGWLKVAAFGLMLIDHTGRELFSNQHDMRVLGRMALPLFIWCMIVGFYYTRDVKKYLGRLLLEYAISQPFYVMALTQDWTRQNICLTLFLGLGAMWGIQEKKYGSHIWTPIAALCLATILQTEGGWKGVLVILLLYAVRDSRRGIAAVMISYFLFWGSSYQLTESIFGFPLDLNALPSFLSGPISAVIRGEGWSLLALPLILVRWSEKDIHLPRWLNYGFYPAHLALIALIKSWVG